MKTFTTNQDLRELVQQWKSQQHSIAFVPTMGNIHQGHISLIETAKLHADKVIVSIFVNPTQFAPSEDFASYPRTLQQDSEKLQVAGIDLLFAPNSEQIYPFSDTTKVSVPVLSDMLCGISRPHFFYGVTTVVNKLFNIVLPDIAVFGEKDYQQLVIIKRMVADLHMPIEIIGAPTGREKDGLAMSSRNLYLSETERRQASKIYKTLCTVKKAVQDGNHDYTDLEETAMRQLTQNGFKPDYIAIRNREDLQQPKVGNKLVVLAAAFIGKTRLIDNLFI